MKLKVVVTISEPKTQCHLTHTARMPMTIVIEPCHEQPDLISAHACGNETAAYLDVKEPDKGVHGWSEVIKVKTLSNTYHLQARMPNFPSIRDRIPAAISYKMAERRRD